MKFEPSETGYPVQPKTDGNNCGGYVCLYANHLIRKISSGALKNLSNSHLLFQIGIKLTGEFPINKFKLDILWVLLQFCDTVQPEPVKVSAQPKKETPSPTLPSMIEKTTMIQKTLHLKYLHNQ